MKVVGWDGFDHACRDAFQWIETELDFRHVRSDLHSYDCATIGYRNSSTIILVYLGTGSSPFVTLQPVDSKQLPPRVQDEYAADYLFMERAPEYIATKEERADTSQQGIVRILEKYSRGLREVGIDMLSGDFSVFSALRKHEVAARRRLPAEERGQ